ncbi:MAG TPA: hypothetical protein V6D17_22195, partial [Candidatus Obscuribacterales bacterium]
MSAHGTPVRSAAASLRRVATTTPGRLKLSLTATFFTAIIFAALAFVSIQSARNSITAIGHQAAPSTVNAQHLRAKLVELDDAAATEFLLGGSGADAQAARRRYEGVREGIARLLTKAGSDASLGEPERTPLAIISTKLQEYNGWVERARAESRNGKPLGAGWLQYASKVMHEEILPQVDALDRVNYGYLDREYERHSARAYVWIVLTVGSGL